MIRPEQLVVATGNAGKLSELRELLAPAGMALVAYEPVVDENGATYEENARLKARAALEATGQPSLGDDSGLEVDVLGGFPGLRSARLAPTASERIRVLLERLQGQPLPWAARFVCVIVLARPDGTEVVARGEVGGEIVPQPMGDNGFGYDPVFLLPDLGRTMAELPASEKDLLSHRGRAARQLLEVGFGVGQASGYPMQPGNGR